MGENVKIDCEQSIVQHINYIHTIFMSSETIYVSKIMKIEQKTNIWV